MCISNILRPLALFRYYDWSCGLYSSFIIRHSSFVISPQACYQLYTDSLPVKPSFHPVKAVSRSPNSTPPSPSTLKM